MNSCGQLYLAQLLLFKRPAAVMVQIDRLANLLTIDRNLNGAAVIV